MTAPSLALCGFFAGLALSVAGCGGPELGPDPRAPEGGPASVAPPVSRPGEARWQVGDVTLAGAKDLTLSPGARYVGKTEDNRRVVILDARTREVVRTLPAPPGARGLTWLMTRMVFSPDDARVVVAWSMPDSMARLAVHEVATGDLVRSFDVRELEGFGFSSDGAALYHLQSARKGDLVASAPDAMTVTVVDLASGTARTVAVNGRAIAVSPRGEKLAVTTCGERSMPRDLSVFDVASGKKLVGREIAGNGASRLAFSPDGKRLAGAGYYAGTIRVWDAVTGDRLFERTPRQYQNDLVAFAPDGSVWSAGARGELLGWDERGEPLPTLAPPGGLQADQIAFRGGEVAAIDPSGNLAVWDRRSGRLEGPLRATADALVFSDDGRRLYGAVRRSGTVMVWDAVTGKSVDVLLPPAEDSVVWQVRGLPVSRQAAWRAAFDAGRKRHPGLLWDDVLSFGGGASFVLLDSANVETVGAVERPTHTFDFGHVYDAAVSPDGKWISAHGDRGPHGLYDAATLERRRDLAPGGGHYYFSRWSPRSDVVALWAEEGRTLGLIGVSPGDEGGVIDTGSMILDVAFSPDGARVALALDDGSIRLIDVAARAERSRLEHPHVTEHASVRAVAFSPDGGSLASANHEGTLVLWNVETPPR